MKNSTLKSSCASCLYSNLESTFIGTTANKVRSGRMKLGENSMMASSEPEEKKLCSIDE